MILSKLSAKLSNDHGRWYGDGCGAALGMELLGERWAALILRELLLGARRFSELRLALPGISARVLTERLGGLESAGLVAREAQGYGLTPWGLSAEPLLLALCRWALQSPARDLALPVSPVAMMLSLRALFCAEKAGEWAVSGTILIGRDSFALQVAQGALAIHRGEGGADFRLEARDTTPLKRLIYGKAPPQSLPDLGAEGDPAILIRLASLFDLPQRVE